MTDAVESTQTMERLNALTQPGKWFDTWNGERLQEKLNETRLILLVDLPRKENWEGDRLASIFLGHREIWFVSKQAAQAVEMQGLPSLFDNPDAIEPTTWGNLAAGQEWYTATKYYIGHEERFQSRGFGQLPNETLAAWLRKGLVDLTASFDEALDFLGC